MGFVIFSLFNVVIGISCRSEPQTALRAGTFTERRQMKLLGLAVLVTILATELGFTQSIFGLTHLNGWRWLVCIMFAVGLLLVDELVKVFLRRRGRAAPPRRGRRPPARPARRRSRWPSIAMPPKNRSSRASPPATRGRSPGSEHWSKVGMPGYELPVGGPGGDEREFLAHARTPAEGARAAQAHQRRVRRAPSRRSIASARR